MVDNLHDVLSEIIGQMVIVFFLAHARLRVRDAADKVFANFEN